MVAIKDFEMPSHCFICPMCNSNNPNRTSIALGTPFTCDITENALLDVHDIRDKDCPLVDAIPKDQYEARLKADLKAILVELQLEIECCEKSDCDYASSDCISQWQIDRLIQQKINELKGANNE